MQYLKIEHVSDSGVKTIKEAYFENLTWFPLLQEFTNTLEGCGYLVKEKVAVISGCSDLDAETEYLNDCGWFGKIVEKE